MKTLSQHILEKLKITKNNISDITLESLTKTLKDYKARNNLIYVDINLKEIFEEYPKVLEYDGTDTNKNIIGDEIQLLGYTQVKSTGKDVVYLYLDLSIGFSIDIENTEELHDIFGEEVLNKIYDYLIKH